jgi:hypothetical protein
MGADLYIRSYYDEAQANLETAREWQAKHVEGSTWWNRWQEVIDRLSFVGYFRDPYNDRELLSKLGLDWSEDVTPRLGADRRLPVDGVRWLRERVAAAKLNLSRQSAMRKAAQPMIDQLSKGADHVETGAFANNDDATEYFEDGRKVLLYFLDKAIERNEPIECDL